GRDGGGGGGGRATGAAGGKRAGAKSSEMGRVREGPPPARQRAAERASPPRESRERRTYPVRRSCSPTVPGFLARSHRRSSCPPRFPAGRVSCRTACRRTRSWVPVDSGRRV